MNRNLAARSIALFLIGICLAAYIHHDIYRMRSMGRDRFLAQQAAAQARRFDRTAMTPAPMIVSIFGAIFVIILVYLCYEFLVFVISKGLKAAGIGSEPSANTPSPGLPFS